MSTSHDEQRRSVAWDVSAGPRNYVTLVMTQAASSFSALVTIWLLTRLLGASGYGEISAIIAAAVLISTAAAMMALISPYPLAPNSRVRSQMVTSAENELAACVITKVT